MAIAQMGSRHVGPIILITLVLEFFILPFWAFVKFLSTLYEGGLI
jgi:hypothetical protein